VETRGLCINSIIMPRYDEDDRREKEASKAELVAGGLAATAAAGALLWGMSRAKDHVEQGATRQQRSDEMYSVSRCARVQDDDQLATLQCIAEEVRGGKRDAEDAVHEFYCFENERAGFGSSGYSCENLMAMERANLSHGDGVGSYGWDQDDMPDVVPPIGWEWIESWRTEEWQYARVWGLTFYEDPFWSATVRRRGWSRRCMYRPEVYDAWCATKAKLGQFMSTTAPGEMAQDAIQRREEAAAALLTMLHEANRGLQGVEVAEELCCPLTMEAMVDPVFTSDGHTYERGAIQAWLATNATSPLTNEPLEHVNLVPNMLARSQLAALRASASGE